MLTSPARRRIPTPYPREQLRNGSAATLLILTVLSALLLIIGIGVFGLAFAWLWLLVDAFLIPGMTQEYNNDLIGTLRSYTNRPEH